mmetsp:Transcript_12700/g.33671  ORF Transcript_12700/g.33671 Transcript_12700/m.33671 type:complete len:99 (+) Transcript_12700:877-1173(+)
MPHVLVQTPSSLKCTDGALLFLASQWARAEVLRLEDFVQATLFALKCFSVLQAVLRLDGMLQEVLRLEDFVQATLFALKCFSVLQAPPFHTTCPRRWC